MQISKPDKINMNSTEKYIKVLKNEDIVIKMISLQNLKIDTIHKPCCTINANYYHGH